MAEPSSSFSTTDTYATTATSTSTSTSTGDTYHTGHSMTGPQHRHNDSNDFRHSENHDDDDGGNPIEGSSVPQIGTVASSRNGERGDKQGAAAESESEDVDDRDIPTLGTGSRGLLQRYSNAVDAGFKSVFGWWGSTVAARPRTVMLLSVAFALAASAGIARLEEENRGDELWIPGGTEELRRKRYVTENFGSGVRIASYMAVATDDTGSAISAASLADVLETRRRIESIRAPHLLGPGADAGAVETLESVCESRGGRCVTDGPLEFIFGYGTANETDPSVVLGVPSSAGGSNNNNTVGATGTDAERDAAVLRLLNDRIRDSVGEGRTPGWLGGVTRDPVTNLITRARAVQTTFLLKRQITVVENEEFDYPAQAFESRFDQVARGTTDNVEMYTFSQTAIEEGFSAAIQGDLSLLFVGIALIMAYLVVNLGEFHRVRSSVALALAGLTSIGFGVASGYGLCAAIGIKFTPVISVLPFIAIAIGIDDSFVLSSSFADTDESLPLEERLTTALAHAGASITVTSLTDILAFGLSGLTRLPALKSFAIYAAVVIFFIYIFQLTLFTPAMFLDARRRDQHRFDCLCCFVSAKSSREASRQGNEEKNQQQQQVSGNMRSASDPPADPHAMESGRGVVGPAASRHTTSSTRKNGKERRLARFLRTRLGPAVTSPAGIVIVFAVTLALAVAGIVGTARQEQDSSFADFIPDGEPVKEYIDAQGRYLGGDFAFQVEIYVVAAQLPARLRDMDVLAEAVSGNEYIGKPVTSWHLDFRAHLEATRGGPTGADSVEADGGLWNALLKAWLTPGGPGARFSSDVNLSSSPGNSTVVEASRMRTEFVKLETSGDKVAAMNALENTVVATRLGSDGTAFAYADQYPEWAQFEIIVREIVTSVSLSLVAVTLIMLTVLGNLPVAAAVILCVCLVVCEVIGFGYFWGVKLDGVMAIIITLAIGLSVDAISHIGLGYLHCAGGSRRSRAIFALASMGTPVINGVTSTLLAVCLLGFSKSFVFRVFFKLFFLTITMGCFHGMFFLPALLSVVGPAASSHEPNRAGNGDSAEQKGSAGAYNDSHVVNVKAAEV